jgi:uncharacterized protein with PIN domain
VKFLCDEMLKRLGQWLRVAGYDVAILPDGTDDGTLMAAAVREGRLLLTRDREIARHKAAADVLVLDCRDLDDCVARLNARLPIDWCIRPFSRCMVCNTPLAEADERQRRQVPPLARGTASKILHCPTCNQLFWDGSHVAHMRARLVRFAELR